jgi:P27 family predicted phage terminase small subunit
MMRTPRGLQPETARWWREIVRTYELEAHHLRLLEAACRAWDRASLARQVLEEQGMTYTGAEGQPRMRPEVQIERQSLLAFARLVRELGLDLAVPDTRPPRRDGTT